MGISKIRPTAPDVKQGPQDRRKTGTKAPKGKNAVDKTPTLTIVSAQSDPTPMAVSEPIITTTQEPLMTDTNQTPDTTKTPETVECTLDKVTKYSTIIFRNVARGVSVTINKTAFDGAPTSIAVTGIFRSPDALKPSEAEKSQKRLEMIQNRLKKDQEEAKALEEKLKAAGIAVPQPV